MHPVLQMLAEQTIAPSPPLPAPARIGPAGEWLLPGLVIGLGLILDATAAGSTAHRDRVAAVCTYTGFLGLISIYGWESSIRGWIGTSWSWVVAGSGVAVLMHVALVVVLVGDAHGATKRVGAAVGKRAGFGSADSNAVGKINTKLHVWAIAAACSYVLSRGASSWIPRQIGESLTHVSANVGGWLVHWLGG